MGDLLVNVLSGSLIFVAVFVIVVYNYIEQKNNKTDKAHMVHLNKLENHVEQVTDGALYISPNGTQVVREKKQKGIIL